MPVLLDPTMMLDGAHWRTTARANSAKPSKHYLLVYMLGDVPNGFWSQIRRFASRQKLKVVCLNRFREPSRYAIGPDAFIDCIQDGALLVTNSFHGAVFSILLERPFVVLRRGGMTCRTDTLLSTFQLMYRKRESLCPKEGLLEVDYSHVPSILLQERQKTTLFLQNAIFSGGLPTSQR